MTIKIQWKGQWYEVALTADEAYVSGMIGRKIMLFRRPFMMGE